MIDTHLPHIADPPIRNSLMCMAGIILASPYGYFLRKFRTTISYGNSLPDPHMARILLMQKLYHTRFPHGTDLAIAKSVPYASLVQESPTRIPYKNPLREFRMAVSRKF